MKEEQQFAERVVAHMMEHDALSQWLGIEVLEVTPGACMLRMTVRAEMDNGFNVTHGGITYSLGDSALAFASNSHGIHAMSIETSISHTRPVRAGDVLTATAAEMSRSNRIAVYHIGIVNAEGVTVALFKGMVFRTGKPWEV